MKAADDGAESGGRGDREPGSERGGW